MMFYTATVCSVLQLGKTQASQMQKTKKTRLPDQSHQTFLELVLLFCYFAERESTKKKKVLNTTKKHFMKASQEQIDDILSESVCVAYNIHLPSLPPPIISACPSAT